MRRHLIFACLQLLQLLILPVFLEGDEPLDHDLESFSSQFEPEQRQKRFSITPQYTGELFTNARGGLSTNDSTQYLGLLEIPIQLDLDSFDSRLPGQFFLLAQNTHGRGLTEDFIGDTQVLSNIDSFDNIMQVGEYWWQFDLIDDRVTLRLGKQDLNTEFLYIGPAEHFIQSTFGLSPSTAFPTYPDQSFGAVVLTQLNEAWVLKTGIWDAFAKGSSWGFSGNNSVLLAGELEFSYSFANGRFPGVFAVGAVYESAGEIDAQPVSPVHEYVIQWEQSIYRERSQDCIEDQGIDLFVGYYPRFPGDQLVNQSIGDSFVAGVTYKGLVNGRDDDVLGIGVASSELFQGGTNRETVTEVFYRMSIRPRLHLQPDLQYIASPSGIHPDALAIGARFQLGF